MEIRKLDNPWSDDLEALVQALPMCWSVEDEMHIKPVDIVRNNDFENPEIGVTHMKDLFLDVTHWRYTSPEDIERIAHELIDDWYRKPAERAVAKHWLEASRRTCFPPELAAPYKQKAMLFGGLRSQVCQPFEVINNTEKALEPLRQSLGKLGGHPNFLNAVSKTRYAKKGGSNGKD